LTSSLETTDGPYEGVEHNLQFREEHAFTAGDVLSVLRVPFWTIGGPRNTEFAIRQVAINAFMALVHLGVKLLARMTIDDWRPKDKQGRPQELVRVVERGFTRYVPPTEALAFAVERYLSIRPKSDCQHLFLTSTGKPLEKSSFSLTATTAARSLELDGSIPTLLKDFCRTAAEDDWDKEAAAYFLGRKFGHRRPAYDLEKLSALVTRTDRFEGCLRLAMEDDSVALDLLHSKYPTTLPAVCVDLQPATAGMIIKPRLSSDHPLVAALAAVEQPVSRAKREELFVSHYSTVSKLLNSGELSHTQGMEIFGYSKSAWRIRLLRATYGEDWWMQSEREYPGSRGALHAFTLGKTNGAKQED
jgi:hypothetical protein